MQKRLLALLAALVAISTMLGCSRGPKRYELSGTVTFEGKPVPRGTMVFAPDSSQGNKGPGTQVTIEDGKFRTPSGFGHIGGPHEITVTGSEKPSSPGAAAKPLFNAAKLKFDLPKQSSTREFVVPASAKIAPPPPPPTAKPKTKSPPQFFGPAPSPMRKPAPKSR